MRGWAGEASPAVDAAIGLTRKISACGRAGIDSVFFKFEPANNLQKQG
jgi:hypothetical protein